AVPDFPRIDGTGSARDSAPPLTLAGGPVKPQPGPRSGNLPREVGAARASGHDQPLLQCRIMGQLEHGLAPGAGIVWAQENAGRADDLRKGPGARGDDGSATAHSLQR